jgi:2-oxoglutarate ferredoxin oxidoreductase subunit alpha
MEAVDRLAAGQLDGSTAAPLHVDYMRIRAFPFGPGVREFIEAHPRCYVVEQNRDGQLRSLLALETGIARDRMISVLDYGGLPLTADRVIAGIVAKKAHPVGPEPTRREAARV